MFGLPGFHEVLEDISLQLETDERHDDNRFSQTPVSTCEVAACLP